MLRLLTLILGFSCLTHLQANTLELFDQGRYPLAPYISYLVLDNQDYSVEELLSGKESLHWIKNKKNHINFGFSSNVYWLKIEVINNNEYVRDWVLEINSPMLDHVDAYVVNEQGEVESYFYAGDQIEVKYKSIKHPHMLFAPAFPYKSLRSIYIRIESQGAIQVPLTLWQWQEFSYYSLIYFLWQGIFYGMVLIMALYSFVVWLFERESINLTYTIYILLFTIFQVSINGIGFQFLWPNQPWLNHLVTPLSLALVLASVNYFICEFFETKEFSPRLHLFLMIFLVFYIVMGISNIFLPYYLAIEIAFYMAAFAIFQVILITIYMLKINHPNARYFSLAWLVFIAGAAMLAGNKFGIIPISIYSEYGMQFGAGLEMMFLSLALADRLSNSQRGKILAQEESLMLAQQVQEAKDEIYLNETKKFNLEKENSRNLEILVKERTIELNSAMEKLTVVNNELQTISNTDALTKLNNRYYFNEHWRIEHKRAIRENSELAIIMLDVDHFKFVNDRYGHPAGDYCLTQVANCISKHVARDHDIACRYGGEEFVVILPGTDENGAVLVAQNIRKEVERLEIHWEEQKIKLSISLGVSYLEISHERSLDRQYLINQADQALYKAKSQGRNQVVSFGGSK
jgi:diguanylate cyclase